MEGQKSAEEWKKKYHLIFHHPCLDGWYALMNCILYVTARVKKESGEQLAMNAFNIIPVKTGSIDIKKSVLDRLHGRELKLIIFADVLPQNSADLIWSLAEEAEEIIVVDHHETNKEAIERKEEPLPPNVELVFDENHSACKLAIEYFEKKLEMSLKVDVLGGPLFESHPETYNWEAYLRLNNYVEDHDLGRKSLENSNALVSAIFEKHREIRQRDHSTFRISHFFLREISKLDTNKMLRLGKRLFRERVEKALEYCRKPFILCIGGIQEIDENEGDGFSQKNEENKVERKPSEEKKLSWMARYRLRQTKKQSKYRGKIATCYAIFLAEDQHLMNQIGETLSSRGLDAGLDPMAAMVYPRRGHPDQYDLSLRSIGDFNTRAISETFSGGGHKNASAFHLLITEFEGWVPPGQEYKSTRELASAINHV